MRGAVLVLLVGCGRIGFDALAHDAAAPVDAAPPGDTRAASACQWTEVMELPGLAAPGTEWEPALSRDGQTLLFSVEPELYRSVRVAGGWSPPVRLELPGMAKHGPAWVSNTRFYFASDLGKGSRLRVADLDSGTPVVRDVPGLEDVPALGPAVSEDELELFYTTAVPDDQSPDIGHATRADVQSAWIADSARVLSTPQTEGWPSLSRDGKALFFEAIRDGETAIWRATRDARGGPWSAPARVPGLHIAGSEDGDPDVFSDDTLVFASDRGDPGNNINLYAASCR